MNNEKLLNLSESDKRSFINTLLPLYKSGIPIIESMEKIKKRAKSPKVHYLAQCISKDLSRGKSFSDVVMKYENSFGKVLTGLMVSGDEAGELLSVLERIQKLLKKEESLRQKAVSALTYPAIVFVMLIFVVCLFTFFVNPLLEGMGQTDTGQTAISALIKTSIVFGILIAVIIYLKKISFFQNFVLPLCLKLPYLGNLLKDFYFSNFFLVLMIGYESGLSATKSLDLATYTLKLPEEKKRLHKASRLILKGHDLSSALTETEAIPENYIADIATGESTGEIDKILQQLIDDIDSRTDNAIKIFGKLLEPAVLIIAGIAVGALMLNFYGNMYKNLF